LYQERGLNQTKAGARFSLERTTRPAEGNRCHRARSSKPRSCGRAARPQCGLNNPISKLHAGGGPLRRAPSGVAITLRAPSTLDCGETVRLILMLFRFIVQLGSEGFKL